MKKITNLFMIAAMALGIAACTGHDEGITPHDVTDAGCVQISATIPGDIWATASRSGELPISGLRLFTLDYSIDDETGKPYVDEETGEYIYGAWYYDIPNEALSFSADGKTVSFVVENLPWKHVAPDEGKYWFSLSGKTPDGSVLSSQLFPAAPASFGQLLEFPTMTPRFSKLTVNVKFDGVNVKEKGVGLPGVSNPDYFDDFIMKAYFYPCDYDLSNEFDPADKYDYIGRDEWNSNHTIQLFVKCEHTYAAKKVSEGCYTYSWGGGYKEEITPQPLKDDTKKFEFWYYDEDLDRKVTKYIDLSQVKVRRADNAPAKDVLDTDGFAPNGIYADGTDFAYNKGEHIVLNITVYPNGGDIDIAGPGPTGVEIDAFVDADESDYTGNLDGTVKIAKKLSSSVLTNK